MEFPSGTTLRSGAYRIERTLGQGGFGITYYGFEVALHRPVAIKEHFPYGCSRSPSTGFEVHPGQLTTQEYQQSLQRFARESRTLAQFDHPSIVRVLTVFEEANTAYLVMEYVNGPSLEQLVLQEGKMEASRAVGYVSQACQALQVVHEKGLLHRDVKPSNLLLRSDGRVVVVDFGSARETHLRQATAMVSAGYSPPELYKPGGDFTPATDVYALGATLYELLQGESPPDCLQRLMGAPVPPVADGSLQVVLERALSLDPLQRYATMAEFHMALSPPVVTRLVLEPLAAAPPPTGTLPPTVTLLAPPAAAATAPLPPPAVVASPQAPPTWGSGVLTGHRAWIRGLASSADGRWLVSGSEDKTVGIWCDGALARRLTDHTGWVWGTVFSEDDAMLYTAGYDRQLLGWETSTWERVSQQRCCDNVQCLRCWGVWLAVGTLGGKLELRRLPDLAVERVIKLPGAVASCAFVQGTLAATAGDDKIYLIDMTTGQVLERLKGHKGAVRALLTLPDGRLLSGGADRTVRLWDLDYGASVAWPGHQGTVLALTAVSGGVVSAAGDKTVRLWNLEGESRELGRHHGEVSALASIGPAVASAGQDNVIRIWIP